jgi:hypothetical protein
VVRGSAALLALAAGVAYFLLAGELPDGGAYPAAIAGAVGVALCSLSLLPVREEAVGLAVLGVGAALLAVALNGRDVAAGATPVEALFAAAAGLLFAVGFSVPAAVVALPILVAGIDAASVLAGGAGDVPASGADPEVLTLDLPSWGDGDPVPRLSLLDATFLALFAAWSLHFALRPRIVVPLLVIGLAAAAVLSLALDRSLPTLPFLAAAFLLPVLDRIPHLLRSEG